MYLCFIRLSAEHESGASEQKTQWPYVAIRLLFIGKRDSWLPLEQVQRVRVCVCRYWLLLGSKYRNPITRMTLKATIHNNFLYMAIQISFVQNKYEDHCDEYTGNWGIIAKVSFFTFFCIWKYENQNRKRSLNPQP